MAVEHAVPIASGALPFSVTLVDSLPAAEAAWRTLEADAILTPYQRYDWLAALLAAGGEPHARIVVALVQQADRLLALLPLVVEQHRGAARARFLGSRQSNSDWMILAPGFHPSPAELLAIFCQIARKAGGIDMLVVQNQPARWLKVDNPLLALPHTLAPSNLYTLDLTGARRPYIEHHLTSKRRTNIKRAQRRIEENFGQPPRLVRVRDAALLGRAHDSFLDQRGERFNEMGVDNIFAHPPFPEFFLRLCREGFESPRPAMVAHILLLGEDIIATSWGTMAGDHYSQYINSTTSGPSSQYSLMNQLVAPFMDELIESGITSFDMGLGDFDYKTKWCAPEPTYHSQIALTVRGRLIAGLDRSLVAAKRYIKQTPALWKVASQVRLVLFRLRGTAARNRSEP